MYKVVIPSAGIGSRIGPYTKFMNKALVTINNKPAIAHIIDNFPDAEEIIIILGYKGDYVRQVVTAFFPERNIKFIEVDNWEGEGSGLGYTLNCAKKRLQCPFIFVSNDTVIPNDPCNLDPSEMAKFGNWMGYNKVRYQGERDTTQYRTLSVVHDKGTCQNKVGNINAKGVENDGNVYIGIAGIQDYRKFWQDMESPQAVSMGESYGMQGLSNIRAIEFKSWCDIGNMESLSKTRETLDEHEFNILEKENEAIWFKDGQVIKFSIDETFISDRIKRLEVLDKDLFPKITYSDTNLYVYDMIEGDLLSNEISEPVMNHVLDSINAKMWQPNLTDATPELIASCYDFYQTKTQDRVDMFHSKYEVMDQAGKINGIDVPTAQELLDGINWDLLCTDPYATAFHGDFHNENILIDSNGDPILIDWRQNFGKGNLEIGDAYYDLAKFNHGLIVSHGMVHRDLFSVDYSDSKNVTIDIHRPSILVDAEQDYYKWLNKNGFDIQRVELLTALIYLNVAALHEFPYSMYLYYLGKRLLHKWGKGSEYCNW